MAEIDKKKIQKRADAINRSIESGRHDESRGVKCTVGPIIGKVTGTTARILIETNSNGRQEITLKAKNDEKTKGEIMWRGHIKVFVFEHLQPNTQYTVTSPTLVLQPSSFRTLPETGFDFKARKPRLAFVQGNKLSYSVGLNTRGEHKLDLWRQMNLVKKLDMVFHLGQQVYNDAGKDKKKGRWFDAMDILKNEDGEFISPGEWKDKVQDVRDVFRNAYREAWNYPATKKLLANVSNIMIPDERDIRRAWGENLKDYDKDSIEHFLAYQACTVVGEYQLNCSRDFFEIQPGAHFYSFHDIGDIGVYIQDPRQWSVMAPELGGGTGYIMGATQKHELKKALNEKDGEFFKCKMLIACCPIGPLPHKVLGEEFDASVPCEEPAPINDPDQSWRSDWWSPHNIQENAEFISMLFDWKFQSGAREVLMVCGHSLECGWSTIDLRQNYATLDSIRVLTPGAIADRPSPVQLENPDHRLELDIEEYTEMLSADGKVFSYGSKQKIAGYRAFGVIDFGEDEHHRATYSGYMVEASDHLVQKTSVFHPDGMFTHDDFCSAVRDAQCSIC